MLSIASQSIEAQTAAIRFDINEDSLADLIVCGQVSDDMASLLKEGVGNFMMSAEVNIEDGSRMSTMGDVNGDGSIDFASANSPFTFV